MAKVKNMMMDQEDTAMGILEDLIDEIDDAGNLLLAELDCTHNRGNVCGFRGFNIAVAKASGRAKRRLNP